jgi:WD40 repeat protein
MVSRPFDCDPNRLRRLLDDRLDDPDQAELADHLESCDDCRRTLDALAAGTRWWTDARDFLAPGPTREFGDSKGASDRRDPAESRSLDFLAPSDDPSHIGRIGPYEVVEVIGRGGMGVVLRALDPSLNRQVAIKVLAPELATSATARRRFAREGQAAAAISHDHIVAIHAVDASGGLPYLVMQLVAGKSLQERLDKTGPPAVEEILRIGMQTAQGLAAAHAVGLIHRDIKPSNILLENCVERVKLSDFGLARAVDDASLTQSGVVAGTPQYMSPEQARGESVDHRTDLFSLGSVLYALCTGHAPFRADSTMAVLRRVSDDTPRPIREVNPEIPDWLAAIVAKLHAKDPADRFATATEVADLLGRCLLYLREPKPSAPPFAVEPMDLSPPRKPRRRLAIAAGIAATALVLLGAAEAAGVTQIVATVLRVKTRDGTMVVKVSDPSVKLKVDGEDVVITGAGPEIRVNLNAGRHQVEAVKDGKVVKRESVTISRGDSVLFNMSFEPDAAPKTPETAAGVTARKVSSIEHDLAQSKYLDARARVEWATKMKEKGYLSEGQLRAYEIALKEAELRLAQVEASGGRAGTEDAPPQAATPPPSTKPTIPDLEPAREAVVRARDRLEWSGKMKEKGYVSEAQYRADELALKLAEAELARIELALASKGVVDFFQRPAAPTAPSTPGRPSAAPIPAPLPADPANPTGPEASSKAQARRHLQIARVYLNAGQFNFAESFLNAAEKIDVKWGLFDDTPAKLRVMLDKARPGRAGLYGLLQVAPRLVIEGKGSPRHFAIYTPDGGRVLTGSGGARVEVWDAETGKLLDGQSRHNSAATCAVFLRDGRLATASGMVALALSGPWKAGPDARIFEGHSAAITSMAASPDGKVLATASLDKTLRLWDLATGDCQVQGFALPVFGVAYSHDGRRLAVALGSASELEPGEVRLIDSRSGQELIVWRGPGPRTLDVKAEAESRGIKVVVASRSLTKMATSVAFAADDTGLAVGGLDRNLTLLDVRDGHEIHASPFGSEIRPIAFSPDGKQIAVGLASGSVVLWNVAGRRIVADLFAQHGPVTSVAFSPDGKHLVASGRDGKVALFDSCYDDPTPVGVNNPSSDTSVPGLALALSPDGKTFASAGDDGIVRISEVATGKVIRELYDPTSVIQAPNPSDRMIETRRPPRGPTLRAVAYTPDGKTLAAAGDSVDNDRPSIIRLWDVDAGVVRNRLEGHTGTVFALAISPDGSRLISGGHDSTIRIWSLPEGLMTRKLEGHAKAVRSLTFAPNGETFASASLDGKVKVWKASDGKVVETLPGNEAGMNSLSYSPDGKSLVAGGGKTVTLYTWKGPESTLTFSTWPFGKGEVRAVAFSPDGRTIAAGGRAGVVGAAVDAGQARRRSITARWEDIYKQMKKIGQVDIEKMRERNSLTIEQYSKLSSQLMQVEIDILRAEARLAQFQTDRAAIAGANKPRQVSEQEVTDAFYNDPKVVQVKDAYERASERFNTLAKKIRDPLDASLMMPRQDMKAHREKLDALWKELRPTIEAQLRAEGLRGNSHASVGSNQRAAEVELVSLKAWQSKLKETLETLTINRREQGLEELALEFAWMDLARDEQILETYRKQLEEIGDGAEAGPLGMLRVWDVASGREVPGMDIPGCPIEALVFTRDGKIHFPSELRGGVNCFFWDASLRR